MKEEQIEPADKLSDKELIRGLQKIKEDMHPEDMERALSYVYDLGRGLNLLRTFPQGVTAFGSARVREGDKYYDKARELGALLAQNGHPVITGGGPGIMEAVNRGAFEYGGRSVGLNITLEHEQFANPYLTDVIEFHYFFARKVMLSMAAKVYVYFPGGFGTLDELSEIVCLMQEGKMPRMPLFLFGKSYWRPLDKFFRNRLLADKMVKASDLNIYKITDDIEDVVKAANKIGHQRIQENLYDHFKN
ncbi:TIGR00730 family Rossman fold protein [Candidatus Saccharibacteria bacterium]|nr:TIGR00730 family Rossman fold protein [Candidatus Saccharibacteria bacterium]MBR3233792.1 TIGR00730 family Rossman fold protein [Candidatus Saccharibacteria bacterium]